MKKILALILVCVLVLALMAGCKPKPVTLGPANSSSDSGDNSNPGGSDKPNVANKPTDYAESYTLCAEIRDALDVLMNEINDKHNEAHPYGDPENTEGADWTFMLFSLELAFTASFTEDDEALQAVKIAFEFFGGTDIVIEHPAKNHYEVLYTANSGSKMKMVALFDPNSGGLSYTGYTDGVAESLYEFIPIGGNQFAFQTRSERAIIEYKDGEILSFVYTSITADDAYYTSADSIFGKGSAANQKWVDGKGADGYGDYYTYDGKTLVMYVTPWSGERFMVEIPK